MRKLYVVKNARDFEKIIKTGKLAKNKSFIIYYSDNDLPYNRYGISVGKKLGNAVYRNKYKRKIRAIIDNYKKSYINHQDYIIILRRSAKDKEYHDLEKDYIALINNIRKDV
ncbi:ribonuclease P protein component [Mycoplasma sp. CAG:877]|nr:ribonuclease P protein component [Mycoplasma sp. CAG:877]